MGVRMDEPIVLKACVKEVNDPCNVMTLSLLWMEQIRVREHMI